MKEKKLKQLMEEQTKDIQIPESLEPENMMKQIEAKAKKKKASYYKKFIAAAASCAVVAGIGIASMMGAFQTENSMVQPLAEGTSKEPAQVATIETAKDYKEIYKLFEKVNKRNSRFRMMKSESAELTTESAASEITGASSYDMGAGHSETNVRENGVGEADIVKTDGERMYVLNYPKVDIVDISQENMKTLSTITLPEMCYVGEIYVKDDRLVVVYSVTEEMENPDNGVEEKKLADDVRVVNYKENTIAETFDIQDPENPKSIGKIKQSGNYNSLRVVGEYVYLFSDYYPGMEIMRSDEKGYIPLVQGEMLESTDIYMPTLETATNYIVATAYSLQNPNEVTDQKAVLGNGDLMYVSKENIYVTERDYDYKENHVNHTCIRKLSYQDGTLKAVGQARVEGVLNDSFSIDEFEGYLRLVTTVNYEEGVMPLSLFKENDAETEPSKDSNSLYILDENLQEVSKIEGLAEDEMVYSARFMGNTGYFVTFRQMDPLFSVDLSDPKNPKILGELKIPGFSEYLHPYGEGKLLGIGMDLDETGTVTNGVKLSMFDISNPTNVQEVQKYVINGAYSTDVAYNYKTAFVDVEKNLIGFVAYGEYTKYYVFSYDESLGFTQIFERDMTGLPSEVRALYAGDQFYLIAGNVLESYRLDTFEKIDDLVL